MPLARPGGPRFAQSIPPLQRDPEADDLSTEVDERPDDDEIPLDDFPEFDDVDVPPEPDELESFGVRLPRPHYHEQQRSVTGA